ncbi:hypothetical protein U8335_20330 [Roseiconus lacunae]|uniref:hypothetical protein n=1 Tax=Roseiconus lacunae TaxID=2605694 RepID=UPI0030888362|nr:hypothetical protein U8335_20330 [Stieleria sp. HD01]
MAGPQIIVELTPDEEKLLRSFQKTQREAEKMGSGVEKVGKQVDSAIRGLKGFGVEGKRAAELLGKGMADAGLRTEKSASQILKSISSLGPEYERVVKSVEGDLDKLRRKDFTRDHLQQLRGLGAAGRDAASKIEASLTGMSNDVNAEMTALLGKIAKLNPEAKGAADTIRRELAEAADYSEGKFGGVLEELRGLGPVGKSVAKELRRELVDAGEIAERSFGDVLTKLKEIDPEIARIANSVHHKLTTATDGSKESIDRNVVSMKDFGKTAVTQLTATAGAYVGIQEAISKVIELNQKVLETNREAFASIDRTADADRRLLQVSKPGGDFNRLSSTADTLAADYGIDRVESRNLVFSARSEGFDDQATLDFIGRNSPVIDVKSQASVAGQIPSLFAGNETISPQQAINATLAAATESRLSFQDIARAMPIAAEGTALIGSTTGETSAALSVLSSRFGSAERAGDRLKAFASKANLDPRLDGKGLLGAVQALRGFSEDDRKKFLGDSIEVNTAYEFLSEDFNAIKKRQQITSAAVASTGTASSPTAQRVAAAAADKRIQARVAAAKAKIGREIETERRRGAAQGFLRAGVDNELSRAESEGVAPFQIAAAEELGNLVEGFGGDPIAAVAATSSNQMSNLARDFRITKRWGQHDVDLHQMISQNLAERRRSDPGALVTVDEATNYLRHEQGVNIGPADMTDRLRATITRAFDQQAAQSRGFGRTASEGFLSGMGGFSWNPLLYPSAELAAIEGNNSAEEIDERVRAGLQEAAKTNALLQQVLDEIKRSNRPGAAAAAGATGPRR